MENIELNENWGLETYNDNTWNIVHYSCNSPYKGVCEFEEYYCIYCKKDIPNTVIMMVKLYKSEIK